jgi:hypothetical protein
MSSSAALGIYERHATNGTIEPSLIAQNDNCRCSASKEGGYEELCAQIVRFFKTTQPPVVAEETIEIFAFMEAADQSKRQGGAPVSLAAVLAKGRVEAKAKRIE